MEITQELYDKGRKYALRICKDVGEDAYHEVWRRLAEKDLAAWNPPVVMAYLHMAIKRQIWTMYKKQGNELTRLHMYHNNAPIPAHAGILSKSVYNPRKVIRIRCRKELHDLTEDNLVYIGVRRTCKMCYRASKKRHYERTKALKGVT